MCGILCHVTTSKITNVYTEFDPKELIQRDLDDDLILTEEIISKLDNVKLQEQDQHNNKNVKQNRQGKLNGNQKKAEIANQTEIVANPGQDSRSQDVLDCTQDSRKQIPCSIKEDIFKSLIPKIATRGPDSCNYVKTESIPTSSSIFHIEQFSSVLSLRQPFIKQPILNSDYNIQFNGELYNEGCIQTNDTEYILQRLEVNKSVLKTIGELRGEFALVIYDIHAKQIYFGRDIVGRRSLSYSLCEGELYVSSLSPSCDCHEYEFSDCIGGEIYCLDLNSASLEIFKYGENPYLPLNFTINTNVVEDDTEIEKRVGSLDKVLTKAVELRIKTIHPLEERSSSENANLGILFSGGLDCTLIAAKSAQLSQPGTKIDLLTVGFDNPRTKKSASESPDRQLAFKSWFYLSKRYPEINFQLVEVNVSYKEWLLNKKRVMKLMFPANTEMDLSIAIAFYFAAKGQGIKTTMKETVDKSAIDFDKDNIESKFNRAPYNSTAKVLFSGLGADELYGGYTRHERLFTYVEEEQTETINEKYKELSMELKHDLDVIYVRNLGRDDRSISSWGKELRYPFLDESFISFSMSEVELNLKLRLYFQHGKCVPVRKYLLRKVAENMGLDFVKDEAKRAIQFGAKSAKMEIGQGKTKGTDSL